MHKGTQSQWPLSKRPSYTDRRISEITKSGVVAPMTTTPEHLTDVGNARAFVSLHEQNIKYCYPRGKWLIWDGKRWAEDNTGEIQRKAKATTQSMFEFAVLESDTDKRSALVKHALKTQSEARIRAMIGLAQSEPNIPVTETELDTNPWLLNVSNGTLDLKTGQLRPHRREDLITKLISVQYDPAATCPTWDSFLQRIMGGNQDLIKFLQKAVGYSLTGDTTEQENPI